MNNIICIAGPTASGKTALAVQLAKELNGEVISCDSMQIYRRMDIGTAKPTADEMEGIPHHMLDVAEPEEDFSVSKYCDLATPILDDILSRGKTAIIAGGTGLYMDALIKGNDFAPFPPPVTGSGWRKNWPLWDWTRSFRSWQPLTPRQLSGLSEIPDGSYGRWKCTTRPVRPSHPTI